MVLENGVKNIQAAAYNGARTVDHELELEDMKHTYLSPPTSPLCGAHPRIYDIILRPMMRG